MSVFIETQGCQMNEYDSDRILNSLSAKLVENPMDADVVIVNTCAIREKADHKAVSALGRYKNLKKSNPDLIIGMAGCVAQLYGDKLIKDIPYLDFVVGPRGIPKLEGLIQQIRNTNKKKIPLPRTRLHPQIKFLLLISRQGKTRLSKWYAPYTEKERRRTAREITAQVRVVACREACRWLWQAISAYFVVRARV